MFYHSSFKVDVGPTPGTVLLNIGTEQGYIQLYENSIAARV